MFVLFSPRNHVIQSRWSSAWIGPRDFPLPLVVSWADETDVKQWRQQLEMMVGQGMVEWSAGLMGDEVLFFWHARAFRAADAKVKKKVYK